MRRRLGIALCVLASIVAGLSGCAGESDSSEMIIHVGNGAEPAGLDPHVVTGVPEHHILLTLFEGLVRADTTTLEPIPGMAESWEVSDDKLVYTFHLRKDAKWSNGEPLTAKDFLYAWRRNLTPSLGSQYSYMLHCMVNAKEYNEGTITDFGQVGGKALDDHTVQVTLNYPAPYFFELQTHYSWFPIQQTNVEKFGKIDDRGSEWTRPGNLVCNGPYMLDTWEPNSVIKVRPQPHYWDTNGILNDGVDFHPVSDENTEERMFRAGELQVTENVPVSKVNVYRKERPEEIRIDDWLGCYFYRVNTTRPPFNDARVRRALAMSIDRDSVVTNIVQGGEKPAGFLTPPNLNGYTAAKAVSFNPEEARRLLAEAGFPDGKGFAGVEIHYNTLDKHKIIAEALQQMIKTNLKVEATLRNEEWKVYLDTETNLQYDISRAGWMGDVRDPINFLECFLSGNGNNRTGWSNPKYDDLVERGRREPDAAERIRLFQEAEGILVDEMPLIPLFFYTKTFLADPRLRGLDANVIAYVAFHKLHLDGPR